MTNAIVLERLTKVYDKREVLSGLNLEIASGSTYGLVGPNGAGKTTLFRIIAGLARMTSGKVSVLGHRPGHPTVRGSLGYMTQAEALYKDLTVKECVHFFGKLFGLKNQELTDAANRALQLVHLEDRAHDRIDSLSGGMRRRASLACAVVHRPKLLLLDEPTVGVDPELRAEFWEEFIRWGQAGTTLVISTHHLDEASRCDRLGLLRQGRLIAEDTPAQLLKQTGAASVEEAFLSFARRQS